jgi:hypothetical protein
MSEYAWFVILVLGLVLLFGGHELATTYLEMREACR